MKNYFKELIMLFFIVKMTFSFNKKIYFNKYNSLTKYKTTLNNNIYNDIYNDNYNDIYNIFLKNNSLCYSFNLNGGDNYNICKNCKYFSQNDIFKFNYYNNNINITSDMSGKFIENINNNIGICNKFTFKNRITGDDYKIIALLCRGNEKLCGLDGKYYEEKKSL